MGRGGSISIVSAASAPWVSPPAVISSGNNFDKEDQWSRSFDNSINAVSFGFVATAILISMFLIMAIVERLLWPKPPETAASNPGGVEITTTKLDCPSPKMTVYPNGVSVLMPGEDFPTFIAHPAPVPCPPERISRPILE